MASNSSTSALAENNSSRELTRRFLSTTVSSRLNCQYLSQASSHVPGSSLIGALLTNRQLPFFAMAVDGPDKQPIYVHFLYHPEVEDTLISQEVYGVLFPGAAALSGGSFGLRIEGRMARAKVTSSSHGEANVFGLGFFRENLEFISVVGMPIMVFKN